MAVGFEADAAIGQSEIADDQVSASLRRETLAVRLCIMRGEKQALLHQRSTSASGGARRTKSHRALIMIGYPPTSAFAIYEFVATSMSIRGWIIDGGQSVSPTAESAIRGCEPTCVRDRAYGGFAGSLIASRSQFAHAAYKTSYFEILELVFCKASSEIKFVLDRIALSGEPPKQALGKDAPIGATQFANSFWRHSFRRSLDKRACCVGRGLWRFKIFGSAICSPRRARMSWSHVRC
jgi:hypothetical protein